MKIDSVMPVCQGSVAFRLVLAIGIFAVLGERFAEAAPANDGFASAAALEGPSVADMVSNVDASKEVDEPEHAGDPGGLSLWWIWTAPSDGLLTVSTAGSTAEGGGPLDTVLALYTGSSLTGLAATEVTSNDEDPATPNTSRTLLLVRSGQIFRIAVDSSAAFGPPIGGTVLLTLTLDASGNNDDLADRIVLSGASVTRNWTNRGGTREAGESLHGGTGGASVWWEWTAPSDGAVTITTAGSLIDTRLAIYTGNHGAHSTLMQFSNDDDNGGNLSSLLAFTVTSGTRYYIAVDGKAGVVGDISFCISMDIPATIDTIERQGDGTTTLGVTIPASCRIRVEFNEDLSNPAGWKRVQNGTFVSPAGLITVRDLTSSASTQRFYRIVAP
jgi:hypothetical protein